MSDMIFKNYDDLSLLDQFRLHVRQRQIDEVLRRSYSIVQDNLKAVLDATEGEINALINMPPSDRYKMTMTSERDKSSLKFRWFITLSVSGTAKNSYDKLFNDREKDVKDASFRIIISPKHIGFELNRSGQRHMFRFIRSKSEDHQLQLAEVDQDARNKAINEVRIALAEWIAHSCPDHAALFFMEQVALLNLLEQHLTEEDNSRPKESKSYKAEYEFPAPSLPSSQSMNMPEINMPTINITPSKQQKILKSKNYEYLTRPTRGKPTYR